MLRLVSRVRDRRFSKFGVGYYAWLPCLLSGLLLTLSGIMDRETSWMVNLASIAAGLLALSLSWWILTSEPTSRK